MKNLILSTITVLSALVVLTSCGSSNTANPQFTVTYTNLTQLEGDTLYLWQTYGDAMWHFSDDTIGALDSAIVTNGTVTFTGREDTLHFYVINNRKNLRTLFYPERGDLTITHHPDENGLPQMPTLESSNLQSKNIAFHNLRFQHYYVIEPTRKMLFDNVGNAIGAQLMKGWARIFPDEIEWVYSNSNEQLRHSDYALIELKDLIDNTRALKPGDRFVDFPQVSYSGKDTIVFSDIVGHGTPVCLLFPTSIDEKNSIRNEMDAVRKQYPDVCFVMPVFNTPNPEIEDFYKELENRYRAILVDNLPGRGEFKNSVSYKYRNYSGWNYSCVFDGEGKLVSAKVLLYDEIDTFLRKFNVVMSVWNDPAFQYNTNTDDRLAIPEYVDFKEYVLAHPQGIYMLLDYALHYDTAFGMQGWMIDDIVHAKYKDAPSLMGHVAPGGVREEDIPGYVAKYINRMRVIVGKDTQE